MKVPIIHAKFSVPPEPASYLPRSRLDRLWREVGAKKLVLVTAGAGFGKTSFLAATARSAAKRSIWYSLDETDADLARFAAHLGAAFSAKKKKVVTISDDGAADYAGRLLARMVETLRREKGGALLILDDLHLAGGSAEIVSLLERAVRFLPAGSTMILISREAVPMATMKLQSHGAIGRITAEDLRFDAAEVERLYRNHFPDASISPAQVRRIVAQTEGWPAGVEMLFQAIDAAPAEMIEETLDRMQEAGLGWFAYFAEEVLHNLEPDVQKFLRRSAVLPRLEAGLCDEVLQIERSRAFLEELCRRNLFTFPVDEAGTAFRYHHLFREFLRDSLAREEGAATTRGLRKRAAAALRRRGASAESILVRAEEGDPAGTLRLVEKLGEELLGTGQYELVRRTLDTIPKKMLSRRPGALLVLGRSLEVPGRWAEAEAIYKKALRCGPTGKERVELLSLLAQIRMRRGDHKRCMALCTEALRVRGPKKATVRMKLLTMLGVAACDLGRLDQGERYRKEAIAVSRRSSDEAAEATTLYLLPGNIHYRRGEFGKAKEAVRRALVVFKKRKDHRRVCHTVGILAYITSEMGEVGGASELAREGLRLAESLEHPVMEGYCRLALARCARIGGNTAEAREQIEVAMALGEHLRETGLRTIPIQRLAEIDLDEGKLAEAKGRAGEALEIARSLGDIYQEAESRILLGLLAAPSDPAGAALHWRRAESIIRRIGMSFDLHRLLLIELDAGAIPEKKIAGALEEVLGGSAALGHDFLFRVLEPDRAARVLPEAIRRGVRAGFAHTLLIELGERAVPHLVPLLETGEAGATERAVDILARIGGDEAKKALRRVGRAGGAASGAASRAVEELETVPDVALVIRALGPLEVTAGERTFGLDGWRSARALRLFQLLLVHRFRWVPRDVLIETLWPDGDPAKGTNNLRQTVHLLRKTLEPEGKGAGGARYVRSRNEAVRLAPGEGHEYDVDLFEKSLQEADALWTAGKRRKAEAGLERAVELYRGDFLAETPFEEFATDTREGLRDRLLQALGRLLDLLAEGRRWGELVPLCRRGLDHDPYHEELYFRLVQALQKMGHRREALAEYHKYEGMMIAELDLLPSKRMKGLADEVISLAGRGESRNPPVTPAS